LDDSFEEKCITIVKLMSQRCGHRDISQSPQWWYDMRCVRLL